MKKTTAKYPRLLKFIKALPLVLCVVLIIICLANRDKITVENIVNYSPKSPFLASLALIGLYAAKSIAVFFPLLVLNIVGGAILKPVPAHNGKVRKEISVNRKNL